MAACELDNTGTPQFIAGPSVPSPMPLHAPYVWDTPEELMVWTGNAVSNGPFSIDDDDSNGEIAIQITYVAGGNGNMVLRGPDIEPAARSIRAVRVRYQWLPSNTANNPGFALFVAFAGANAVGGGLHPRASATLKAGPGWKELEVPIYLNSTSALPDVRYAYFWVSPQPGGLLKIDTITLVN